MVTVPLDKPIFRYIFTICSWSTLKVIGASRFATVASLLPIVGYLLVFNEFAVNLLNGFEGILRSITSSSSNGVEEEVIFNATKLKLMYLGLWAIGFATLAFRLFCPKIIRDYQNEREFIEASLAVSNETYFELLLNELRGKFWFRKSIDGFETAQSLVAINEKSSVSASARGLSKLSRSDWLEKNENGLNLAYGVKYKLSDFSLFAVRLPIFLLFAFGFLTTLLPSIGVFTSVAGSLL